MAHLRTSHSRPTRTRQQKAYSSPDCVPCSPLDSGYGSQSQSPERDQAPVIPKRSSKVCRVVDETVQTPSDYDGTLADLDDDSNVSLSRTIIDKEKFATLPRTAARRRPAMSLAFYAYSAPWLDNANLTKNRRRLSGGSLRVPDRFVPQRGHSIDVTGAFQTNKRGHELSTPERILRNDDATPDAFTYSRHRDTPITIEARHMLRSESAIRAHFVTSTGTVLSPLPSSNQGHTERQVSRYT
jgi:hypothetical protein